jgi:predicted amidohydrolase
MKKTIRFAGAQIPVTPNAETNLIEIKKAIDWASENSVDYLVTPEASLSGYVIDFNNPVNKTYEHLQTVEKYAAEKNVGLCLGTIWDEIEGSIDNNIRRNQIRFYNSSGNFLGATNKTHAIEYDRAIGVEGDNRLLMTALHVNDKIIPVAGIICIDMYSVWDTSNPSMHIATQLVQQRGAKLLIHATNGVRNQAPTNGLSTEVSDKINNDWADIHLRRMSFLTRTPIITVDNCYMCDGSEYHGNTSSESGVLIDGEWVTKVPRTGTQYFYYDFDLDKITIDTPEELKLT